MQFLREASHCVTGPMFSGMIQQTRPSDQLLILFTRLQNFGRSLLLPQQPLPPLQNWWWWWLLLSPFSQSKGGRLLLLLWILLSGDYPDAHHSSTTDCILTKFNLENNTDSSGYFSLNISNYKRVKDSVIKFRSTNTLKWFFDTGTHGTLSIEGSFAIASGTIDGGGIVTLTTGTTAQTRTPFLSRPYYDRCWIYSKKFSNTPQISLSPMTLISHIAVSFVLIIGIVP